MTYFTAQHRHYQRRRAEILGSRKRKPRRCDLARQRKARYAMTTKLRAQLRAARRLEAVL